MRFLWISLLAMTLTNCVYADSVKTKTGDYLVGQVKKMRQDHLIFNSKDIGEVSLKWNSIVGMETEKPIPIRLKDGQVLIGKIAFDDPKDVEIEIDNPKSDNPTFKTTRNDILRIQDVSDITTKWSGNLGAGGAIITGNTRSTSINASGNATMDILKNDKIANQLLLSGFYNFLRVSSETQVTQGQEIMKFLTYFAPRWDWFIKQQLYFNRKQKLSLRAEEQIGVDYHMIVSKLFNLAIDFGFGRVDSFYNTRNDRHNGFFAFIPSLHFWWNIWDVFIMTEDLEWSFNIGNPSDNILENQATLTVPLGSKWAFQLKDIFIYTSEVPKNTDKSDNTFLFNLMYTF